MSRSTAYLLISHGSRDPRPHQVVDLLARAFWQQLSRQAEADRSLVNADVRLPNPAVGTATLELGTLPLHQQIVQFAYRAAEAGHHTVDLLPLFLLPGVHVMEDLPAEIAIAQQQLHTDIELRLMPHIGASTELGQLIQFSSNIDAARVLLAHGTHREAGNLPIEAVAAQHQATPAYWAIEPCLKECVQTLIDQGYQQIEIQPYFLFAGSITDAIAHQVEQLSREFETVQFHLLSPLGMTSALVNVLIQMAIAPKPVAAV